MFCLEIISVEDFKSDEPTSSTITAEEATTSSATEKLAEPIVDLTISDSDEETTTKKHSEEAALPLHVSTASTTQGSSANKYGNK